MQAFLVSLEITLPEAAVFLKACSFAGWMEAYLHNSCESRPALPSRISEDGVDVYPNTLQSLE